MECTAAEAAYARCEVRCRLAICRAILALLVGLGGAAHGATPIAPVSAADPSVPTPPGGSGDSAGAVLSADGSVVVFVSSAGNLVTNLHHRQTLDVYARVRATRTTTLISVSWDGSSGGDGQSSGPSVSTDGRYVSFESRAQNLVTNQTTGLGDVYLRDTVAGTTTLVSTTTDGRGGNGPSGSASLTPDGRFVVFESWAGNLAPKHGSGAHDVFVRDLTTGLTTLVSANSLNSGSALGAPEALNYSRPVITPDGRYVAFESYATNITADPVTAVPQIYVRDLALGASSRVTQSLSGQAASDGSYSQLISDNGRYVVFESSATNLAAGATAPRSEWIFRRDLLTHTTDVISQARPLLAGPGAMPPSMSADAQVIAYAASNQVYLWSEAAGTNSLVSTNAAGFPSMAQSDSPLVSSDGSTVVFLSAASDNSLEVTNSSFQVFAHNLTSGTNQFVTLPGGDGSRGIADALSLALSADGGLIAFDASDGNLAPGDNNRAIDVFLRDLAESSVELVSARLAALPLRMANAPSFLSANALSADGRYALYTSAADNLGPNETNAWSDIFLRDLATGSNILVSVSAAAGGPPDGARRQPAMSQDGRYVAFINNEGYAPPTYTNGVNQVFVRDLVSQTTTLATNVLFTFPQYVALDTEPPAFSADARYLAFSVIFPINFIERWDLRLGAPSPTVAHSAAPAFICSLSTDGAVWFVDNATGTGGNLFRFDFNEATNEFISAIGAIAPAITPDGRFAFGQTSDGKTNQIWRYDAKAKQLQTLVSIPGTGPQISPKLVVSADGRFIVFMLSAASIKPFVSAYNTEICVTDAAQPGDLRVVSVGLDGALGDGPSDSPSISADGRLVVFRSSAGNLTPEGGQAPRIFVRDLAAGVTQLIGAASASLFADAYCFPPAISADGSTVVFASTAANLVPGDYNDLPDLFAASIPQVLRARIAAFPLGGAPTIFWQAEPGTTYEVQYKDSLGDLAWTTLAGVPAPVPGTTNQLFLSAAGLVDTGQRFYRLFARP